MWLVKSRPRTGHGDEALRTNPRIPTDYIERGTFITFSRNSIHFWVPESLPIENNCVRGVAFLPHRFGGFGTKLLGRCA